MTLTRNIPCQGGCGKVRSILCSDSPADWLCNDCRKKHTHYIAMSGMSGCLPDSCNAYETYQEAVDALADMFELGRTRKARLFANNILKLNPKDGADYCEIQICNCSKPWEHCDAGMDPRDWSEYQTDENFTELIECEHCHKTFDHDSTDPQTGGRFPCPYCGKPITDASETR